VNIIFEQRFAKDLRTLRDDAVFASYQREKRVQHHKSMVTECIETPIRQVLTLLTMVLFHEACGEELQKRNATLRR
jgi:hypothetical protein